MKRLERLTAILSFLQSRRYTSLDELCERFEMSERTIFRDLKALEASGVPLSFEKDRGYYVADRHFLPPLALTLDEAKSFIFVEQLARKYTDRTIFEHFSSALEKIKNKLRDYELEDFEKLQANVSAWVTSDFSQKYLYDAEQAIAQRQVLRIEYEDAHGRQTERMIEPLGMTFYSQNWHLIAWCQLRTDHRDFALSRVKKMVRTEVPFTQKPLSLSDYIKKLETSRSD